jgi:L-ascorbate metabolism protein UlaG (beta-lactamase superfamily)
MVAPTPDPRTGADAESALQPDHALVTWAGHATALIELDGVRILTDPVLVDRIGPLRRIAAPVAADLSARIDAVLLSHLHADHTDLRSLRMIGTGTRVLAPRGAAAWLARRGFDNVEELTVGEATSVGQVEVSATPALHGGRRRPGGARADPIGFVVRGARSVYFAGDTDLFEEMSQLAGSIDLALLPVWGWGPALGPGHLDPDRAVTAALRLAPRVAVPIHWGTFALPRGLRRPADPEGPAKRFASQMARRVPEVEARVIAPGGRLALGSVEGVSPASRVGESSPSESRADHGT